MAACPVLPVFPLSQAGLWGLGQPQGGIGELIAQAHAGGKCTSQEPALPYGGRGGRLPQGPRVPPAPRLQAGGFDDAGGSISATMVHLQHLRELGWAQQGCGHSLRQGGGQQWPPHHFSLPNGHPLRQPRPWDSHPSPGLLSPPWHGSPLSITQPAGNRSGCLQSSSPERSARAAHSAEPKSLKKKT